MADNMKDELKKYRIKNNTKNTNEPSDPTSEALYNLWLCPWIKVKVRPQEKFKHVESNLVLNVSAVMETGHIEVDDKPSREHERSIGSAPAANVDFSSEVI